MKEKRRSFIKKTLGMTTALVATGVTGAMASSETKSDESSNGVVKGKSPKKESLYKETAEWDAYYKASY